jgi:hypothetical protein
LRLQRSRSNDGKTLLSVDLAEIQHTPKPARSPAGNRLNKGKIETLQAEIARLKELAAGHRADFERERDRFDRTMNELLRATTDSMIAREEAAFLKGEAAAPRSPPWWRRLAGWLPPLQIREGAQCARLMGKVLVDALGGERRNWVFRKLNFRWATGLYGLAMYGNLARPRRQPRQSPPRSFSDAPII